jgi:hypothetical protein
MVAVPDAELIVFADPEQVLVDHLGSALAALPEFVGVPVSGRIPSPRPTRFVRVRVVGGTQTDLISDVPTLVVEAYASLDTTASRLAAICRALLEQGGRAGYLAGTPCRYVDVVGRPQNLPDPLTEQTRYTATYAVSLRGSRA